MEVSVYNQRSAQARSLLTKVSDDDKFAVQVTCSAHVQVEKAFFVEDKSTGGVIGTPYMKMLGKVSDLFIEDYDNREFPCGTKQINLMQDEPVEINYVLSTQEIQQLVGLGLCHKGFAPPANLEGNVIDIPLNIVYTGIYESPCCVVEIIDSQCINTSTKDNGYAGLFEACQMHPDIMREQEADYVYAPMNESAYIAELAARQQAEEERRRAEEEAALAAQAAMDAEPVHEMTEAEKKESEIFDRTVRKVEEVMDNKDAQRDSHDDSFDARKMLDDVQAEAGNNNSEEDEFGNLYGSVADTSNSGKTMTLSDKMAILKQKAEKWTEEQVKAADETAGNDEFAYESDEQEEESETQDETLFGTEAATSTALSDVDREREKAEKDAKRRREIVRRVDVANDNKLLNEGIDDIAGQTSASDAAEKQKHKSKPSQGEPEEKGSLAQQLLAGVMGNANKSDDSKFL